MREWMDKIQFHAALPPNLQLLSYKEGQEEARKSQDLPGGDDSERVVQFARTLPRNTPSPMSNGNSSYEQTAPMPKPRITRLTLPESPDSASSYGNGSSAEVVSPVPEYPAAGSNGMYNYTPAAQYVCVLHSTTKLSSAFKERIEECCTECVLECSSTYARRSGMFCHVFRIALFFTRMLLAQTSISV